MSLEPDSVERLRKKLYEKAKQEPDFRFYSLYDKVCWAETLQRAYRQAKANAGAAGVDGVRNRCQGLLGIRPQSGQFGSLTAAARTLSTSRQGLTGSGQAHLSLYEPSGSVEWPLGGR